MSYYKILNVSSEASVDEIKKAYRNLALIMHPDKNKGKQNEFISIKKAWEILSNPQERKVYDAKLELQELQSFAISDKVYIEDFDIDDTGNYFYCCRHWDTKKTQ